MHRWALLAVLLTLPACAARNGAPQPRPFPGATLPPAKPGPEANADADAAAASPSSGAEPIGSSVPLLAAALALQGAPYRNGGSDPSGFDCSGFVQYVFARIGIALPRETREQFTYGRPIGRDQVRPGDLVFFETVSRGPSHVGIALGDEAFVHAPSSRGVVRVERYTSSYWDRRWIGARRIIGD